MIMALGLFVFHTNQLPFSDMDRKNTWRYGSSERIGMRPVRQFVGRGDESIGLSGWLAQETLVNTDDTLAQSLTTYTSPLEPLRAMANTGYPQILATGTGDIMGSFAIESINEKTSLFYPDGTPRKISFDISLIRMDHNAVDNLVLHQNIQDILKGVAV